MNLSLSFRQLNSFKYDSGSITFNFFALTTQSLTKGHTIELLVNLILESGEQEENTTLIECELNSDITVTEGETKSAKYECSIDNLKEVYTSLRFNSSEFVAGVPTDDEVALNPVLTDQAISNGEVKDSEKVEPPPTFIIKDMEHGDCSSSGSLTFKGELSEEKSIITKFTIPLTYPEGISITCSLENNQLICKLDRDLEDSMLIEQTIIKDGADELFILQSISTEPLNCGNAILKEAEEKVNVDISFRQVSTIKETNSGLSFFFAAFVNNRLNANYEITMKVLILEGTVEKNATCHLKEAVNPTNGEPIQGDFDCEVELTEDEKKEIDIEKEESLTISPDNNDIGGCAELTDQEKSPKATDIAIEESEEKSDENLAKVLDYSKPENKELKPPTFEVTSFNLSNCENSGTFKVKGKFSEAISEELTFDLPFSFPASKIKCTVNDVTKEEEVEIKCKVQKGFRKVKSFVLEPRLIKKKCVEKLFIKGNNNINLNGGNEFKCENFNDIKLRKAKLRQKNAVYSFLQLSRPPLKRHMFFFMVLRSRMQSPTFEPFKIKVNVIVIKNRLRILQSGDTEDLGLVEVQCNKDTNSSESASFGCLPSSDSISIDLNPSEIEIDGDDDQIVGAPDDIKIETNPTIDLTDPAILKTIDELSSVAITNITSLNCSTTGQYKIEGNLTDTNNKIQNYNKSKPFLVPFSNPDSSGSCKIESVENNKITLLCDNTEEFTTTQVMISSQLIKDPNGNPIFKITNDATAPLPFACDISENGTIPLAEINTPEKSPDSDVNSDDTDHPTNSNNGRYHKSDSSGLSGGAIAGIVVACVAVAAIIAVLIGLAKKGTLFGTPKPAFDASVDNSSTINRFKYVEGQN